MRSAASARSVPLDAPSRSIPPPREALSGPVIGWPLARALPTLSGLESDPGAGSPPLPALFGSHAGVGIETHARPSTGRPETRAELARLVHDRLMKEHGPVEKIQREPLDELVLTILSQNTTDVNRDRAWERLQEECADWEEVREGGRDRLEETIRVAGLASQKSGTILRTLDRAREDFGETTLRGLKEEDDAEALRYLRSIKGVGLKTAACVLAFSLRRNVIPVDTHVHRVAERTGLVPEGGTRNRTHRVLNAEDGVPGPIRLPLHLLLIRHGRATCTARSPDCGSCPLVDLCPRVGVEDA